MLELISVAIITILAVISPGADFAMTTRNSYLYGRTTGLLCAAGIALGVLVHVCYTIMGVGLIISKSPNLFLIVKIIGAAYLIYIGYKTFIARVQINSNDSPAPLVSKNDALRIGFMTNALNPKTMLFVVSTYTQVVNSATPLGLQIAYGCFMSFSHWVWFSLVAIFFSHPTLRATMIQRQTVLNRAIGLVLMGLGASLISVPVLS